VAVVVSGGLVPTGAAAAVPANPAAPAGPQLASITASGAQANSINYTARVSGDGRYVAFGSRADNLVTNQPVRAAVLNVYLKDRLTGSIRLITHASGGADGDSHPIDVSADGQYVAFKSEATNLVHNKTGTRWDVYRWDRSLDTNTLVSTDIPDPDACPNGRGGARRGSMTDDGRLIMFTSSFSPDCYLDTHQQVYVRNMQSQTTELVSANIDGDPGNADSFNPVISGNGRYVAFESQATDLLRPQAADPLAPRYIYVRDLLFGVTWLVSLPNGGGNDQLPTINEDGSVVAYEGSPGIWVWEMFSNSTIRVDYGATGWGGGRSPVLNADATVLAFESWANDLDPDGDSNGRQDVYVTAPRFGGIHRVSTAGRGCEPNNESSLGDLSADGTLVVFDSDATNLTHRDRTLWADIFVAPTRSHPPTEESNCTPVKD
jgi:Tol biopolymer transport system component